MENHSLEWLSVRGVPTAVYEALQVSSITRLDVWSEFITQTINNTLHDYVYLQVTRFKLLLFQLYAQY